MYSSGSSYYSMNQPARVICAVNACKDSSRFVVGSCSLHDENSVSVLSYREDSAQLTLAGSYSHADQIWSMQTSYSDTSKLMTCGQPKSGSFNVKLWHMRNQSTADIESVDGTTAATANTNDLLHLDEISEVKGIDSNSSHHIAWHKAEESTLLTSSTYVALTDISETGCDITKKMSIEDGIEIDVENSIIGNGISAFDPHSSHLSATAFGSDIYIIDWRANEISSKLSRCHGVSGGGCVIRDLDYNPNKPMSVISCGDDRQVKFWDLRKADAPVLTLQAHNHWAWSCKYNPFHDELVLSGGSDHLVNLWRVASVSSAPWLAVDEAEVGEGGVGRESSNITTTNNNHSSGNINNNNNSSASSDPPDILVKTFDQHEESVYSLAWSAADAWIFASLSNDGRVFVNHVPSTEKYKILL